MTVQTNTNVASFNGNGVTQIFPIAFKFNNDTDLVVLLVDDATGSASLLTLNSDYTVSGEGDEEGGLINVVVAPASGKRLKVTRVVDILQLTDLRNQGKFFAEIHEDALDLLTMIAQQHESGINSSLRVAESDPEPARIPAVAQRANKILSFDAAGNPQVVAPVTDSSTELRQDLANSTDLSKGAAQVARATRHLVDISEVSGVSGRYDGDTVNLLSFWRDEYLKGGAAYIGGENIGGGLLTWRADIARSEHDGVLIISPTVPAPAAFADLSGYYAASGESDPAASGCWVRSFSQGVHLAWTGAVLNDATKDNRDAFEAAKAVIGKRVGGHMPALLLPIGELYYSKSPNFGQYSGFKIVGPGPGSCRLRYTGTGRALELNPAEYDVQFRYGYHLEGFLIDAGASGVAGLYLENIAQSAFREVFAINGATSCVLFDLRLSVLNEFTTCGVTVNRWAVSSVHQESWRVSTSPSKGGSSTANTFNNCIGEGASLAGWRLIGSDVNTWNGGAGEANTGRGVLIASTSRANTFINFAMEANTTQDARDEGQLTRWIGGYATSDSGFVVGGTAKNVSVAGLMCNGVTIETGAVGTAFENVDYNHKGTGTFTDNGTDTRVVNLRDKETGSIVYPKKARASITVGDSPFTYTNNTGRYQQVLISGGTVTQILYKRGADQGVTGQTSGVILVAPGDELVISHSGAPTMSRTPMGVMPV